MDTKEFTQSLYIETMEKIDKHCFEINSTEDFAEIIFNLACFMCSTGVINVAQWAEEDKDMVALDLANTLRTQIIDNVVSTDFSEDVEILQLKEKNRVLDS
jgi:hypothetical protein